MLRERAARLKCGDDQRCRAGGVIVCGMHREGGVSGLA